MIRRPPAALGQGPPMAFVLADGSGAMVLEEYEGMPRHARATIYAELNPVSG